MDYETENIEFKSEFTEEIYKEVIAFANTEGGTVYIGIDNNGNVIGLKDVDAEYQRITNGIRDAIMPDVTMFVRFTIQENKVVRITVNEGTNKPYYLKGKGIRPSGVYKRQGTSSVQASPDQIRKMIKDSDGDNYEEERSIEQELTFDEAQKVFDSYSVEFSNEKYRNLGIQNNGTYTNLALLLSDQCRHSIKIAVFKDETCTEFRDSREFTGSVLRQFSEASAYLNLCNKTTSVIKGMIRTDKKDYPDEAIREALLNAIIHRDYSFSGSIIINVNASKMEFISIGGLLPGISKEDICMGISQPRNRRLADIFHRLRLVESYGTGIRRIFKLYENCSVKPQIDISENVFRMVLPNMNELPEVKRDNINPQMNQILEYLSENKQITDAQIQQLLNVKQTRAYVLIKSMIDLQLVQVSGRGKNKTYFLK